MEAFYVTDPGVDDWEYIRRNGWWYSPGTAGYDDVLKRGHPRPEDERTIFAELYSPVTEDFLHRLGGLDDVPFLASERAASCLEEVNLSGFLLGPVEVVKIATTGRRRSRAVTGRGEPEDLILKARDKISVVSVPRLFAVHVIGTVSVAYDHVTGKDPETGYGSPFELPEQAEIPDLWQSSSTKQPYVGWVFCSPRFEAIVEEARLTNIRFVPFREFMQDYRLELSRRAQAPLGWSGHIKSSSA